MGYGCRLSLEKQGAADPGKSGPDQRLVSVQPIA